MYLAVARVFVLDCRPALHVGAPGAARGARLGEGHHGAFGSRADVGLVFAARHGEIDKGHTVKTPAHSNESFAIIPKFSSIVRHLDLECV